MTWNTQVASHSPGVTGIAFVRYRIPPCHQIIETIQWPTTTARMLTARRARRMGDLRPSPAPAGRPPSE
ncbi:MAG TPA: hypothetical protein VGB19_12185 [Actinomycetota bacterium]